MPKDIDEAISSLTNIADVVIGQHYDLIINLETWFMPYFLASVLKEAGLNVQGNTINFTIDDLFQKIRSNTLTQPYFQNPSQYLASTFPLWLIGRRRGGAPTFKYALSRILPKSLLWF